MKFGIVIVDVKQKDSEFQLNRFTIAQMNSILIIFVFKLSVVIVSRREESLIKVVLEMDIISQNIFCKQS